MDNNQKTSIICPACHSENDEGSQFCAECGSKLHLKQSSENNITCPKCGTLNRQGAVFCADCGKNLSGKKAPKKHKKRKLAKKLYKGSKDLIKTTQSHGVRKTAKKETWHVLKGIDSFSGGRLRKLDQKYHIFTRSSKNPYGYLICDTCSGYYELKKGVSPDEFKVCTCGGKLFYSPRLR